MLCEQNVPKPPGFALFGAVRSTRIGLILVSSVTSANLTVTEVGLDNRVPGPQVHADPALLARRRLLEHHGVCDQDDGPVGGLLALLLRLLQGSTLRAD